MDFKEIVLTKKQYEELESKEKAAEVLIKNVQIMFNLLAEQKVFIRTVKHSSTTIKDVIFTEPLKRVVVSKQLDHLIIQLNH